MKDNAVTIDASGAGGASLRRGGLVITLWRRRGTFLAGFAAVVGASLIALVVLPVRYLATGAVIVAEQDPGIANSSAAWLQKIGDPADLESQLLVIRSPRVLRLAMSEAGVVADVERECRHAAGGGLARLTGGAGDTCGRLKSDSDALVDYLQTHYVIGSVGRSRVINISYGSPLPDVAQRLSNALITAFLNDQRTTIATGREVAATWLWQQLRQLDTDVRDQDDKIQAYRREKGLMRGATAPISSERLTSISQQLSAAEAARADAAARLQEIRSTQARGMQGVSDAPAVLASRSIADLKQQMAAVEAQLANASSTLGPAHPTLRSLQRERDDLQARFAREVASIAASAQKTFDGADALVKGLKAEVDAIKGEVATATAAEAAIESMVRNVEIKRQQYAELHRRASELETERRILLGSTRLVNYAELPEKPFFPKRLPFLAAGLTLGLLLGAAAALFRDRTDRSVRSGVDLSLKSASPLLAQIPSLRPRRAGIAGALRARAGDRPIEDALREQLADGPVQNAIRKLYSSLALAGGGRRYRTLLVTSAGAGEGKTFITLALAQFAAAAGRRVLVVECDLGAATYAKVLDIRGEPGLAQALRGMIAPQAAITHTGLANLDAVPAGRLGSNEVGVLAPGKIDEFVSATRHYDLVLFDGAMDDGPLDAAMLASHVDGILCCARWGLSDVDTTAAFCERLRAAGGEIAGVAVTQVVAQEQPLYDGAAWPIAALSGARR